jgi:hypothetical protein
VELHDPTGRYLSVVNFALLSIGGGEEQSPIKILYSTIN